MTIVLCLSDLIVCSFKMRRNRGFTLIEVLVSTFILAVGALGATGLQLRGLDSNRHAMFSVGANQLASDLFDRIEINAGSVYGPIELGDEPLTATDCSTNDCSPGEIAAYDMTQWQCSINSMDSDGVSFDACNSLGITGVLPAGTSSVKQTGNEYAVEIQWVDSKFNKTSSVKLFTQVK